MTLSAGISEPHLLDTTEYSRKCRVVPRKLVLFQLFLYQWFNYSIVFGPGFGALEVDCCTLIYCGVAAVRKISWAICGVRCIGFQCHSSSIIYGSAESVPTSMS